MLISGSAMTKSLAATLALGVCASVAGASGMDAAWGEFERRCLIPFEDFAAPVVSDLPRRADGAFVLPTGAVLTLLGETDDGTRSCVVEGTGLAKGFEHWRTQVRANGRYVENEAPGYWLSHEWIEPVIAVEKTERRVRVVETERES